MMLRSPDQGGLSLHESADGVSSPESGGRRTKAHFSAIFAAFSGNTRAGGTFLHGNALLKIRSNRRNVYTFLLHRIAIAHGHRLVI